MHGLKPVVDNVTANDPASLAGSHDPVPMLPVQPGVGGCLIDRSGNTLVANIGFCVEKGPTSERGGGNPDPEEVTPGQVVEDVGDQI